MPSSSDPDPDHQRRTDALEISECEPRGVSGVRRVPVVDRGADEHYRQASPLRTGTTPASRKCFQLFVSTLRNRIGEARAVMP